MLLQLAEVLGAIALIVTPIAASLGAYWAFHAKAHGKANQEYTNTGNGHTLGEAVADMEIKLDELASCHYRNSEGISKLNVALAEHMLRYKHERSLVDE